MSDAALLDRKVLTDWQQIDVVGWSRMAIEIIEAFMTIAPEDFDRLRAAHAAGEMEETNRISHSLKSSCANVGATLAARTFARIESAAESADHAGIDEGMSEAERIFPSTVTELNSFREELGRAA